MSPTFSTFLRRALEFIGFCLMVGSVVIMAILDGGPVEGGP